MNRKSFAFFVALLIHIVIFLILYIIAIQASKEVTKHPKKEKRVKIALKDFKIQKPKKHKTSGQIKQKPKPKPPLIAPPMPKGGQLKKIVQKPLPKYNPKQKKKTPHLNEPKSKIQEKKQEKPQNKVEKLPPSKNTPFIPYEEKKTKEQNLTKKESKKSENPLYSLLSEDHSSEEQQQKKKTPTASSGVMQNIKELYGEEFGKLSPGQQQYILDNQEIMRRITQQVLNRVARVNIPRDLSVNTYNVIEFKLHPDGSMTDFRFIKKSGVYILDETTKETIEYAYSKYPHPKETTLIRYNVFYNLARY